MPPNRLPLLVFAALALAGPHSLLAQADVIRGRVTAAPDNAPIYGAVVTATSISGNVSRTAHTNTDGRYTITFPGGDGDYWINVAAIGYSPRRFELKRLADEAVLVADARLAGITLDTLYITAGNRRRVSRNDQGQDVSGSERGINPNLVSPDQAGDLAAMAATLPGVQYIPGSNGDPSGFSVLGLSTDQNLTTLNGMNSGATDLPRDAAISTSVATSPYDVSQGGFSGGALNIRTQPGSNYYQRGLSGIGNMPQLEWTDPAGRSLGQEYTNVSVGGQFSGPLAFDKAFYNFSFQGGRRANDLTTLLNTDSVGYETSGVWRDSVARLDSILNGFAVPVTTPAVPTSRLSDQGNFLGTLDFMPPSSSSGQALNLTVNGSWNRSAPASALTTSLPASSFAFTNWAGSGRLRHTGYLGFLFSETGLSLTRSHRYLTPYINQPAGNVLVHSDFPDGTSGVQVVQFGGTAFRTSGTSTSVDLNNQLSWFSTDNKHRIKLTSEIRRDDWSQEQSFNLLGSFAFNSLADLQAGRPASFTRQLAPVSTGGAELIGALSLGDSYRVNPDLQIVYGARVDANKYLDRPQLNPAVSAAFPGLSNDHVPDGVYVSPRIGFSWVYGSSEQIGAFFGSARVPRGIIRGGIGLFQNTLSAQLPAGAMANTGLPSGAQQITCVGAAAPVPNWPLYESNPDSIPTACANGAPPVFANIAPNVTLFDPAYRAQQAVRTNLQWTRPIIDNRFMMSLGGTYSLNQNQTGSRDLNFGGTQYFTLPDEGNRPVFVHASSISPLTGAIAPGDGRRTSAFNRVSELRSIYTSRSAQLQLSLSPLSVNSQFTWGVSYTLNSVRDKVSGFSSTAANPTIDDGEARSSGDWRHQIQVNLGANLFDLFRVNLVQRFQSGTPFTPVVSGDINGDGAANDRAFIADPATTANPTLAAGMSQLLAGAGSGVRSCLNSQLGQVAARNSCEGPWTTSGFLSIAFNPLRVKLPQRATVSLQISNPLGAADLLLHGESNLRGWGQNPTPDPRLLIVHGFDSTAHRYVYEVNQRFGSTSQQVSVVRNPVTLTLSVRFDIGPARERQTLTQTLDRGRTLTGTRMPEGFLRGMYGNGGIINPMATILGQSDSLRLTGPQADSLATLNRWYVIRLDSIWTPVVRDWAALPDEYDQELAYASYRRAREASVDLLLAVAPGIKDLLTPTQRRRLPDLIVAYLDQRYLVAIRSGTSGSPGGVFAPASGVPGGGFFGGGGNVIIR